jgi:hypothetical protein
MIWPTATVEPSGMVMLVYTPLAVAFTSIGDFVGFQLNNYFVGNHRLANRLFPFGDGGFGYGFPRVGTLMSTAVAAMIFTLGAGNTEKLTIL